MGTRAGLLPRRDLAGGALLPLALLLTLPATARADLPIDGTYEEDRVFVAHWSFEGADRLYYLVATNYGAQGGWVCYDDLVDESAEECANGGSIDIETYEGNDFVALLYSDDSPPTGPRIADGYARDVYVETVALCLGAEQKIIEDIEPFLGKSADIYRYCDKSYISTGTGSDEIHGTPHEELIEAGAGSDGVFGGGGEDSLNGEGDNDTIDCRPFVETALPARCTALGGQGDDTIIGGSVGSGLMLDGDMLDGGPGRDMIRGGPGGDDIVGGEGDDWLFGEMGCDRIMGQGGNDVIGGGTDLIAGCDDVIDGGSWTAPGVNESICRSSPDTMGWDRDPNGVWSADTDCTGFPGANIQAATDTSPRFGWATRYDQVVFHRTTGGMTRNVVRTTSAVEVMNDDRVAGATLLLQSGGGLPFAGCFSGTSCSRDGVAYFLPDTAEWVFDNDLDGFEDQPRVTFPSETWLSPFRRSTIRPFVGDFDLDGRTDLGYFDAVVHRAYVDTGMSGAPDPDWTFYLDTSEVFGAGDLPVAGRFTKTSQTELAFFRQRTGEWFEVPTPSGMAKHRDALDGLAGQGSTPVVGDFDGDGLDEPGAYNRSDDIWQYWRSFTDATEDVEHWYGDHPREHPFVGDFDSDGLRDDIGLASPSGGRGSIVFGPFQYHPPKYQVDLGLYIVDAVLGDAVPLFSRRAQSDHTCGPQSLEMALRYRELTGEEILPFQWRVPRDLAAPFDWTPRDVSGGDDWDPGLHGLDEDWVGVGYWYSAEHIVYDALRQLHQHHGTDPDTWPPDGPCSFIAGTSLDNTTEPDPLQWWNHASLLGMDYQCGDAVPGTPRRIQVWDRCSPGVLMGIGDEDDPDLGRGLPGVANRALDRLSLVPDAHVIATGEDWIETPEHYWRIVTGFIDHGLPLVIGVEGGNHMNTVIGYWQASASEHYMYTAEPLDGAYRYYSDKPMRWQRFELTQGLLDSGLIGGPLVFGYTDTGGCAAGNWADAIDDEYGPPYICD